MDKYTKLVNCPEIQKWWQPKETEDGGKIWLPSLEQLKDIARKILDENWHRINGRFQLYYAINMNIAEEMTEKEAWAKWIIEMQKIGISKFSQKYRMKFSIGKHYNSIIKENK